MTDADELVRRLRTFAAHFGIENMPWESVSCDDGRTLAVMVCHAGDVIFHGDPNHQAPDDQERFHQIVELANSVPALADTIEAQAAQIAELEREASNRLRAGMRESGKRDAAEAEALRTEVARFREGYVRNCDVEPRREGDTSDYLFYCPHEGGVIPKLDGYAIVPTEQFATLRERLNEIEEDVVLEQQISEKHRAEAATLRAERDELKAVNLALLWAVSDTSRELGLAQGKLLASQWPGIVDGWKERAEKAEAERDKAVEVVRDIGDAIEIMLNMVDGNGAPPDWDWLRNKRTDIGAFLAAHAPTGERT